MTQSEDSDELKELKTIAMRKMLVAVTDKVKREIPQEPFGPPANRLRAKEIAQMDRFGILEFMELTGVGTGQHGGIYHVDEAGVTITGMQSTSSLSSEQELSLRRAARKLCLSFPCTPNEFTEWYDATRGLPEKPHLSEKGCSDFPLARGFLQETDYQSTQPDKPVPSAQIVAAFCVGSPEENSHWWKERMGSAKRYGLVECRATGGKGQKSSWHPVAVALWLIAKRVFSRSSVVAAMRKHFPNHDISYLEI